MTPNPQDSAVALEVERAKFEAWYCADAARQGRPMPNGIANLREENHYGGHRTMLNGKWEGWQARASQSDGTSGVPDGLKLAPVEPTDEMLKAGRKAIHDSHSVSKKALLVYQAMLSAAPNQGENHVG